MSRLPVRPRPLAVTVVLAAAAGALTVASAAGLAVLLAGAVACLLAVRPTALVVVFVAVSVFANYLSSWFPSLGAYPGGALLRDLLALLLVLVAAASAALRHRPLRRATSRLPLSLRERHVLLSLFLFLGALMLAALAVDPDPVVGVYAIRNLTLYVAAGIAAFMLFEAGVADRRTVGDWLLGLGVVASAIGVLDSATHGAVLDVLGYDPGYANVGGPRPVGEEASFFGHDRASGGVTNAVSFGYLAALVATYGLYRLLHERGPRSQRLLVLEAAAVMAGGAGCALSLTRGALLALALTTTVVILAAPSSRWRSAALVAGVATLVGLGVVAGTTQSVFEQRVTSGDVASKLSSEQRQDEFAYAVDVLERHPLGVGLGSYGKAASRYAAARAGTVTYEIQHVPLLGHAFQLGLLGVLAALAVFAVLLRNAAVNIRRGGVMPLCALVIFAASFVLGTGGEEPVSAVPLYVLLALFLARPLGHRGATAPARTTVTGS